MQTWIVISITQWKACLSQGSSASLSVLCEAGTSGRGFQLLPSRRHCVCVCAFHHPLKKHFICTTVPTTQYLHLSCKGFVAGLADGQHWSRWSCVKTTTAVAALHSFAQYVSLIINSSICIVLALETVFFWGAITPYVFPPLCAFWSNALNVCGKGASINNQSISAQMLLSNTSIRFLQWWFSSLSMY